MILVVRGNSKKKKISMASAPSPQQSLTLQNSGLAAPPAIAAGTATPQTMVSAMEYRSEVKKRRLAGTSAVPQDLAAAEVRTSLSWLV